MLERLGPKVWDRIGPGMAAKYWDDPAKKIDGNLCYSAIDTAACSSAWSCLVQAALLTPIGLIAVVAAATDPMVWSHGGSTFTILVVLAATVFSYVNLIGGIRWTQLAGTMAADGVCDDLFVEDDEDEEEGESEGSEEDDELEDEKETNVVQIEERDAW